MDEIYRKVYKAIKRCWEVQQSVHKLDRFTTKLGLEQQDERVLQDYLHRVFEQLNQLETELGYIVDSSEQSLQRPPQIHNSRAPGLSSQWQGSATVQEPRYCTHCGGGLPPHGQFCPGCGSQISHSQLPSPQGYAPNIHHQPPAHPSLIERPSSAESSLIVEGSVDHGSEINHAQRDVNISYGYTSSMVECSTCRSDGFVMSFQSCSYCGGEGCSTHVLQQSTGTNSEVIEVYGCLHCGGSGMTRMSHGDVESLRYVRGSGYREVRSQCPACRGHGKVKIQ